MAPGLPVRLAEIAAVAHQPAGEREVARLRDRRHLVAHGERGKLLAAVGEVGIGAEDQSAGAALARGGEQAVELGLGARLQHDQLDAEALRRGLQVLQLRCPRSGSSD